MRAESALYNQQILLLYKRFQDDDDDDGIVDYAMVDQNEWEQLKRSTKVTAKEKDRCKTVRFKVCGGMNADGLEKARRRLLE